MTSYNFINKCDFLFSGRICWCNITHMPFEFPRKQSLQYVNCTPWQPGEAYQEDADLLYLGYSQAHLDHCAAIVAMGTEMTACRVTGSRLAPRSLPTCRGVPLRVDDTWPSGESRTCCRGTLEYLEWKHRKGKSALVSIYACSLLIMAGLISILSTYPEVC